ncbi:MAG: 30S ribosomal protein S18 [Patescibacteria group bacterium]
MNTATKKQCHFCAANIKAVDFKDIEMIWKFLTPQAQIVKRRKSGTCALHQRALSDAIKRARFLGLVPFTTR